MRREGEPRIRPFPERGGLAPMSKTTPATLALARAGIVFEIVAYDYDPHARRIGLQAAEAIGVLPRQVLKTLMAAVDGKPVCVVVPSDAEVSMKKLAVAFGGKSAAMMKPSDAERLTGYKVGGISPFGQRKPVSDGDRRTGASGRARLHQRRAAGPANFAQARGRAGCA